MDSMELSLDLTYKEQSVAILDKQMMKIRTKEIASVKIRWGHRPEDEAIFEIEADIHA